MENLQEIQKTEISGKAEITKEWFRTGNDYPPAGYPPIERIETKAPADATHYYVDYDESFFWGKRNIVTTVIYYK